MERDLYLKQNKKKYIFIYTYIYICISLSLRPSAPKSCDFLRLRRPFLPLPAKLCKLSRPKDARYACDQETAIFFAITKGITDSDCGKTCDTRVCSEESVENGDARSEMEREYSGTGMTGRPGHRAMEMNGRSAVSYLVRTPRVPFFVLILIGLEVNGGLTFQRLRCTAQPSPGHVR